MREKIADRGIDIEHFFKMFDKNGDGIFSSLEFECAFVALEVDVSKEDLRRFISLTDSNKDGKVDFNEFNAALNENETFRDEDLENAAAADLDASFENFP